MRPLWIKYNSEREKAFNTTLIKCGVTDKQATEALTSAFKAYREAMNMYSMPTVIDMYFLYLKLRPYRLLLKILEIGEHLRLGQIGIATYILMVLPFKLRFKIFFKDKGLTPKQKNYLALFMKNNYNKIMQDNIKAYTQYLEDNNIETKITSNFDCIIDLNSRKKANKLNLFNRWIQTK